LFLILFSFFFNLNSDCLKLESYYIIGDYKNCIKESHERYNKRCVYVKGLCYLENKDYDEASYIFSKLITSKDLFIKEFSFNSIIETYFLKGNYSKINVFTDEILNKGIDEFSKNSYTKLLNKFLVAKMYLINKNKKKAKVILDKIKENKTDKFLYSFFIIK
jgi:hypothetical protein